MSSTADREDRLKGVAAFVQAVEAGSFAAAAQRSRQTRSAVGKAIARLEQRLGVRLFNRSTRRLALTESGQAYYERCKRALAEIEAAEAALDAQGRPLTGRLRVSLPRLLGRHLVAPLLWRVVDPHPGLQLELSFSDRVVDLIEEGFDLAVRQGPLPDSRSLAGRSLGRYDFVLCAAPRYLRGRGVPRVAEEFAAHVGIVYAGRGPESPWLATDPEGQARELPVQRRVRLDDVEAIADAALAGLGIARLPRWLAAPHVAAGALQWIWDGPHRHPIEVHAVWPHTRLLPAKTRLAIDTLAGELPRQLSAGAG
jgi:DNA-binding transcriptional LysR family regulator